MSQELNIIGDIAGNYLTLQALLAKMPQTAKVVSVGDMVDRGPRSKEVLEYIMANGLAVMGNHEHMMLDYLLRQKQGLDGYYDAQIWQWNGGTQTLKSFDPDESGYIDIDMDLLNWLQNLPLYLQFPPAKGDGVRKDGLLITHGPIRGDFKLDQCLNPSYGFNRPYKFTWLNDNIGKKAPNPDDCVLWNRGTPRRLHKEGFLQVYGHNSAKTVKWFGDDKGYYAVCLDTSADKVLTGMHWPSLELFEQDYID